MTVANLQQPALPPSVLSIAGSDSGGGAGIQADLKTFAAHRIHGLTAIAALTAQNTRAVAAVQLSRPEFLTAQIDAVFDDFRVEAVKLGMLATAELIEVVATALQRHAVQRCVIDPVMIASSGAALLQADAVAALRSRLLPLATVLTPNLPEAEALLGHRIRDRHDMPEAARALLRLGPRAVLLKGGHLDDDALLDLYCDTEGEHGFEHPRLPVSGHGTGCTLSSAIAAQLALGCAPLQACKLGCAYLQGALRHAYRPGQGEVVVLEHFWQDRPEAARGACG